jgi:hypothetical protein
MNAPPEVLARPVFSVGAQDYHWADVIAAARAWGRRDASARASPAARDEMEAEEAAQAFRYERSLLAAEEMEAWLGHWGLTVSQWKSWLRGDSSSWAEAVCSGALARLAHDLAASAAAAEAVGEGARPVESGLDEMDAALGELTRSAVRESAGARLLETRSSDWVRIRYEALSFRELDMAREAVLCVREDGLTLAEVAARAGGEAASHEALVVDIDPDLAKTLLGTPVGELTGPLPVSGWFVVAHVQEKVPLTLADPAVRKLLDVELRRRAIEREVRNRVRWHDRV